MSENVPNTPQRKQQKAAKAVVLRMEAVQALCAVVPELEGSPVLLSALVQHRDDIVEAAMSIIYDPVYMHKLFDEIFGQHVILTVPRPIPRASQSLDCVYNLRYFSPCYPAPCHGAAHFADARLCVCVVNWASMLPSHARLLLDAIADYWVCMDSNEDATPCRFEHEFNECPTMVIYVCDHGAAPSAFEPFARRAVLVLQEWEGDVLMYHLHSSFGQGSQIGKCLVSCTCAQIFKATHQKPIVFPAPSVCRFWHKCGVSTKLSNNGLQWNPRKRMSLTCNLHVEDGKLASADMIHIHTLPTNIKEVVRRKTLASLHDIATLLSLSVEVLRQATFRRVTICDRTSPTSKIINQNDETALGCTLARAALVVISFERL